MSQGDRYFGTMIRMGQGTCPFGFLQSDSKNGPEVEVKIAKSRNGPLGTLGYIIGNYIGTTEKIF